MAGQRGEHDIEREKAIGRRLRALINEKKVKPTELADHMSISKDMLDKKCSGTAGVTHWLNLAKAAEFLKVTPNEILEFPSGDGVGLSQQHLDYQEEVLDTVVGWLRPDMSKGALRELTRILTVILNTQLDLTVAVPPEEQARIRAETLIQLLARPKRP